MNSILNSTRTTQRPPISPTTTERISLRDHFAGLALQGIISNKEELGECMDDENSENAWEAVAKYAYMYADAMLKARSK